MSDRILIDLSGLSGVLGCDPVVTVRDDDPDWLCGWVDEDIDDDTDGAS